jgi:hypothetical protein
VDDWERQEQEAEQARQQAEQQLPPGWRLGKSDHERYTIPGGHLDTYSAAAAGPDGEVAVVVALSEAAAWGALLQRVAGDLPVTQVWAPDW